MNILFFIPELNKESGGVYQYSILLFKILGRDIDNKYFILNLSQNEDLVQLVNENKNLTLLGSKQYYSFGTWKKLLNRIKNRLIMAFPSLKKILPIESNLDSLLRTYQIDIVHSPMQYTPRCNKPVICTMHDVQELYFPAFFSSEERARRAVTYKRSIDEATKVIVSYNHVKNDIINFFAKDKKDVHTILLDIEKLWIDKYDSWAPITKTQSSTFLLYPAATWEHKNHINLIKAIAKVNQEGKVSINVVCTGNKTEHFTEIEKLMRELNVQDNFDFQGIVSDDELFGLYATCYGVIVPTLYEAGSFPLMESILLNRPVICSNVTSLPETIGSDEFTFDPTKIDDIARIVERFMTDKEFYERNLENVKRRASVIRNNDALNKVKLVYSEIMKGC